MKTIGIMTGNSLDGVDVVLTGFDENGIRDLASFSKPYSREMTGKMLKLREIARAVRVSMDELSGNAFFAAAVDEYTRLVASAVNEMLARSGFSKQDVAAIGFHGQTCDHCPPSIAGKEKAYTLQVGNARLLADLTGIPVICDFRSDDVMNGGEGAPLAPVHNLHISKDLKTKGIFPVAFCNAGNTGNIAIITEDENGREIVAGWDAGPFNHYPDYLARLHKNCSCDLDGSFGKKGKVIPELLDELFNHAAADDKGNNFFLLPPPKSSDPSWYRIPDCLNCRGYSFEDTIRTAEYLSVYVLTHTLSFVPEEYAMPASFLVFGGGWKNPLAMEDFNSLLRGNAFELPRHKELFAKIRRRMKTAPNIGWSDICGYSGKYMEARIFADMARCRIIGEPFTFPAGSGCRTPTVAGIYFLPKGEKEGEFMRLLRHYKTENLNMDGDLPVYWSRAAKGWQKKRR